MAKAIMDFRMVRTKKKDLCLCYMYMYTCTCIIKSVNNTINVKHNKHSRTVTCTCTFSCETLINDCVQQDRFTCNLICFFFLVHFNVL